MKWRLIVIVMFSLTIDDNNVFCSNSVRWRRRTWKMPCAVCCLKLTRRWSFWGTTLPCPACTPGATPTRVGWTSSTRACVNCWTISAWTRMYLFRVRQWKILFALGILKPLDSRCSGSIFCLRCAYLTVLLSLLFVWCITIVFPSVLIHDNIFKGMPDFKNKLNYNW